MICKFCQQEMNRSRDVIRRLNTCFSCKVVQYIDDKDQIGMQYMSCHLPNGRVSLKIDFLEKSAVILVDGHASLDLRKFFDIQIIKVPFDIHKSITPSNIEDKLSLYVTFS